MEEIIKEFDEKFPLPLESYHKAYWDKPDKNGNSQGIPSKITNETDNIEAFIISAISQAKEEGRKQGVEEAIKALPKFTSYGNESEDFVKARATGKNSYRSEALAVLKSLIN